MVAARGFSGSAAQRADRRSGVLSAVAALQCRSLRLKTWEWPPVWVGNPYDPSSDVQEQAAAALLRRMVSPRREPFPPRPADGDRGGGEADASPAARAVARRAAHARRLIIGAGGRSGDVVGTSGARPSVPGRCDVLSCQAMRGVAVRRVATRRRRPARRLSTRDSWTTAAEGRR
jgi:hypothetical protein